MLNGKKLIAVTGGIGSGKSTVCNFLKEAGQTVISCDKVYSDMLDDEEFVKKISNLFNIETITENGKVALNKHKLADLVFSDVQKKELLNNFTHPEIWKRVLELATKADSKIVFIEVPLLFENNSEKNFDNVWVVFRDNEERINSVMARDGLDREHIEKRMKNQYDYSKIDAEHTAIHNSGDLSELKNIVLRLLYNT